MTLQFDPLSKVIAAGVEARTEAAAGILIRALGYGTMHSALCALQVQGLIDEQTASHLALELMGDLSLSNEHIQALGLVHLEHPALGTPVLAREGFAAGHLLDLTQPAEPSAEPGPPQAEPAPVSGDRYCPVCGVAISAGSIGCRAHWRQVKRDRAEDEAL